MSLAGRLVSKRVMGKASFAHILDGDGQIQLYFKRDVLGDEPYAEFKKYDIGDIIGVTGEVFVTHMGETTVNVTSVKLLSKSLLPLPEKFHGLTNTDLRYRQRYVDLIVNPEVKSVFVKRSMVLREIRNFLDEKRLSRGRNPRSAQHRGRRKRKAVHYAPQHARYRYVPSYCSRTLS